MSKPALLEPWLAVPAAPRKVKRKLTEAKIQKACVDFARQHGYWARKFSSPSQRSVPDYLFGKRFEMPLAHIANTNETHVDVKWAEEFKAPKKKSTEAQTDEQLKMVEAGWHVIADTGTNGQADIDAFKQRILHMEMRFGGDPELQANWPV